MEIRLKKVIHLPTNFIKCIMIMVSRAPDSDMTSCIKSDKPLVVFIFSNVCNDDHNLFGVYYDIILNSFTQKRNFKVSLRHLP